MGDIKEMIKTVDLATRQKLFFYELIKSGVVVFDLNNPIHADILTQIVDAVTKSFSNDDYSQESEIIQIEMKNKHSLDLLIVQQLLQHAKNKK